MPISLQGFSGGRKGTTLLDDLKTMLDRLDAAIMPGDMNLPGYRFHRLKGDRADTYSVAVTGNLRLTFRFEGEDAMDVNLEDYH